MARQSAVPAPRRLADIDALERAYRRLDSLGWGTAADGGIVAITIPLAASAADVFDQWQSDNEKVDEDSGGLFKNFVGKMDGTVLRLALIRGIRSLGLRGWCRAARSLSRMPYCSRRVC